MDEIRRAEDLVRRFAAALRARSLYAPAHPIAGRSLDALATGLDDRFRQADQVTLGFLGDDVIYGRTRLKGSAAFGGLVRQLRERQIDRISFTRDMNRDHLRGFIGVLSDRDGSSVPERLAAAGIRGVTVGLMEPDAADAGALGVTAARHVYSSAIGAARHAWSAAAAGDLPDPGAARTIIDALARAVSQDRASMMALTQVKGHDSYTFTHMVNVSLLTMAQARALGLSGSLVREFGLAGLMHDVGKVRVPPEVLTKPGRLTAEERTIVERHVVDGAQILRKTPEMPALAPIVAFEHHLRLDLSGYPAGIGTRTLNLCTMMVSIADVFDALRSNRAYRDGLPADRVRAMLAEQSGTAFEPTLLRRFITLMGIFPVGTLVRLQTGHVGVVTAEHPTDPYRPEVRVVTDTDGALLPAPVTIDTSARDSTGEFAHAVLEAVDASDVDVDPLAVMTG